MIVAVRLNFVIFNPYFIIFACGRGKYFFQSSFVLRFEEFLFQREPKENERKILIRNRVQKKNC